MNRLRASVGFLLLALLRLPAEEVILSGQEAPRALFELGLEDAPVELYLAGSWTASLSAATGWLFKPDGVVSGYSFPSLEHGLAFQQQPDLTLSLWLKERWFLEYSLLGSFEKNTFLFGYQGREGEPVQSVVAGNRDVRMDPFRLLDVPDPGSSSLGASARFEMNLPAGPTSHQLLLRYDNDEQGRRVYVGSNLVEEQLVSLAAPAAGRFFLLPDAGVEELAVYLEDEDGTLAGSDGRRYRKAELADAVLDAAAGTVSLKAAIAGSVLVYYRKGAAEVGDPSLGAGALVQEDPPGSGRLDEDFVTIPFDWGVTYFGEPMTGRQVTVTGSPGPCLRLWMPGEFSPFEVQASYAFSGTPPADLSRLRVRLVEPGQPEREIPGPPVSFRLEPGADTFTAWRSADLRGDPRNRYPFLGTSLDPRNLLYGPQRDPQAGYLGAELLVQALTPVETYRLEADILPGSVRVLRNGVEEGRFELEPESGTLTFRTWIHPDDRLEIRYRRRGELLNNGDLLFAWGNRLPLADRLTLEAAAGLRWNFLPGAFSEQAFERTGAVVGSVTLKGEGEVLSWTATAGAAFTNPDTTGTLRLLGMEKTGIEVPLDDETAAPAAPPATADLAGYDRANRGRLLYKDYRDYGAFGSSALLPYTATPPAGQVFPYETGSRPGPYLAAGSSGGAAEERSLVLDFELGDGEWAGAQLPLGSGGLADLSGIRSVSLSYRALDLAAPVSLYLQLGELGEDLDGDGTLDEEPSPDSSGWSFNDDSASAAGAVLKVGGGPKGTGNGRLDGEDADGNGFLDAEHPGRVVTLVGPAPLSAMPSFATVSARLDPGERALLTRSRGARLIVVNESGAAAAGRLLVDRLVLSGSRFWVDDSGFDAAGTVTAREIEEVQADPQPTRPLPAAFPEVADTFHPYDETQKVLEMAWEGGSAGSDTWTVKAFTEAASGGIGYRRIVHYLRQVGLDDDPGAGLTFRLADGEGKGIAWTLPAAEVVALAGTAWAVVEVSPGERRVRLNGSVPAGAAVSVDPGHGSLTTFSVSQSGSTEGRLFLDELHLRDPRGMVGAGLDLDLSLRLDGPLVRVAGVPVVSDLTLTQKLLAAGEGFSTLYGRPEERRRLSSRTEASVSLPLVDLAAELQVQGSGSELGLSGGHRLALPNVAFPVSFSDSYRSLEGEDGRDLLRSNTLDLRLPDGSSMRLSSSAISSEGVLTQEWAGAAQARLPLRAAAPPGGGDGAAPADLAASARLGLRASADGFPLAGYPAPGTDYFTAWLQGYRLLLPWEEGSPLERKAELATEWRLSTRPLGVELDGRLSALSFDVAEQSRSLESAALWTLGFPLLLGPGGRGLTLKPGYRRKVVLQSGESGEGGFRADADLAFRRLGSQSYGWAFLPFQELFDPAVETAFADRSRDLAEALYVPEALLALERPFGSRLRDLLLPSRAQLGLAKEFRREADTVEFRNLWNLSLQSSAVNLFGRAGVRPLFRSYQSDEFGGSLEAALTTRGERVEEATLGLEQYASFEGGEGRQLTFSHRLQVPAGEEPVTERAEARLRWRVTPEGGVRLPLLRREVGLGAYFAHEESLEAELSWRPAASSWHPLRLLARHGTSLVLPEHGSLLAELSVGVDQQAVAGPPGGAVERWLSLGVKALLQARLQF